MKKVAIILAVAIGVFGSAANADSAKKIPTLTLAMNNNVAGQWVNFPTSSKANIIDKRIDLELSKKMEQLTKNLDKKLEAKFSKEIDYAM